jgi:hypothetical protein
MSFNAIAYVVLMLISTILLIYTLYKQRDANLFVLYLTMSGLIYTLEYVIFVLFNSYTYKPRILNIEYYDSIIGAIASNGFVLPVTLVFISAFNLRWVGMSLAVLTITGIELLYLYLGIFEHHWWNVSYTIMGLSVFVFIAKLWLKFLRNDLRMIFRVITLFLTGLFIHASVSFLLSGVLQKYIYSIGWFDNIYRDSVAFHTLYNFLTCFLIAAAISSSSLMLRLSFLTSLLFLSALDYVLLKNEILILMDWSLWGFIIIRFITVLVVYFINTGVLARKSKGNNGFLFVNLRRIN